MEATTEKIVWQQEGTTVYTLMHYGWRKGEEQFRNRFWFGVQRDYATCTDKEAEDIAAFIVKAMNSHDQLVTALRQIATITKPQMCLDGSAKVGSPNSAGYDFQLIARAALTAAGEHP